MGGGEEEEGRGGVGGEEIKLRGRGLREIRRGGELRGSAVVDAAAGICSKKVYYHITD